MKLLLNKMIQFKISNLKKKKLKKILNNYKIIMKKNKIKMLKIILNKMTKTMSKKKNKKYSNIYNY